MSYLQKISQLHDRVNQARDSAQSFEDKIKNDVFETAEAKKNDLLGHIARHYEDINRHLQTAGTIAFTTGAAVKHGTQAVKSIKAFRAKRAAEGGEEGTTPETGDLGAEPTGDLGAEAGEESIALTNITPAAAAAAPEAEPELPDVPFPEVEVRGAPGEPAPAPEAGAEEGPEVGDGQGGVAPRPEGEAPGEAPPAPEAPTAPVAPDAGDGALVTGEEVGGEGLLSGLGDAALSAVPIIGDLATIGLIIGQSIEGAKAAKKEEAAEETAPSSASAPGTTIASTGLDARSLGQQ